ncbi:hypothetical protein COHA_003048 [Chlorella ohadii]|uniref:RING-CH-type domain-containing protein n=1 Tax=Chlorella ohadii TaxID=2649997 RepID=A0AAD5H8A4_9CHLO|nr:hypothetical protein COHA_003048 [Chlorella ohadii]
MAPSLDGAQERQPLLELQQHDAEVASIAAGAAAPPPAAGPPPDSAGAATDAAAGTAAQPPAAALAQRLLSEKRCRYCLQEEEPGSQLEAPCKCAGSIKWAHHACVQRWVDEKHDKLCEICGSQFLGDYSAPPQAESPRALLVAQLQVTNDDTRIVSLADPATGEVVARMVMGPGAELRPNGTAAAAGGFQHFPAAVPAEAGATATSIAALVGCLLYFLALMALLVTIPLSMTADAGSDLHLVRMVLIFLVIALRVLLWSSGDEQQEQQAQQQRQAAARRARQLAADLEAGLPPRRPHAGR